MAKGFENYVFNDLKSSGFCINYGNYHFPKGKIDFTNRVDKHIEIYNLIKEYVDLHADGRNASEATAALIKKRMDTIAKKLAENYYVVTKDELE